MAAALATAASRTGDPAALDLLLASAARGENAATPSPLVAHAIEAAVLRFPSQAIASRLAAIPDRRDRAQLEALWLPRLAVAASRAESAAPAARPHFRSIQPTRSVR